MTVLADIAGSLATIFEDLITSQINRSTVALQLLPVGPGQAKGLYWNARFGTDVGGPRPEGADLVPADFQADRKVPASLEYGSYDAPFSMTGKSIATAMNSTNPAELENLFADELGDAVERLAKGLNRGIFTGTGAAEQINGLYSAAGPLALTGTYAGISRVTEPQWASNVEANGGVLRALTFDLMRAMSDQIYDASGENVDLIMAGSAIWSKYGNLFADGRRFMQEVTLRGQKIILSGGHKALEFDGVPVVRDVDHPANVMSFITTKHCKIAQLPDAVTNVNQSMGHVGLQGTPEADFGSMGTGLIARINPLGRNGDNYRFQLIIYPQFGLKRPNACGSLTDIDPAL